MTVDEALRTRNRRIWQRTVWITGIAALAGGILGAFLAHRDHHGALLVLSSIMGFGGLAGAFSLFPTQVGRSGDLRIPFLGVRPDRRRAIRRNVFRRSGKPRPSLSSDERQRARDYAEAFRRNQPVATVQGCLFFFGILGTQLINTGDTDAVVRWVRLVYLTVIPTLLLLGSIVVTFQVRRATAYVHEARPSPATRHSTPSAEETGKGTDEDQDADNNEKRAPNGHQGR